MKNIYISCFSFIFALVLFLPGSGESTVSINILTPQESEEVSDYILVSADIKKDGRPFLETPGLRWVSAIIEDSRGVDSLRISLRDNGKREDSKPNDGIWTSLAKVKLAEGEYRVFVVLRENGQTFSSPKIKFNIKTKPQLEMIGTGKVSSEITSKIDTYFESLNSQLLKTNGVLKWMLSINMIMSLILIGAISFIILKNYPIAKKPIDVKTESKRQPEEIAPTEKWRPVFSTLENMGKEISQIQKDISGTFSVHRRHKENFGKVISNIISLYENIKDLKEIPNEHFGAFKLSLGEAFETVGVERWEPDIGKPVPEGCIQEPATQDYTYPEGTIVEVLSPGYRIRENGGFAIIKKPTVRVVVPKKL